MSYPLRCIEMARHIVMCFSVILYILWSATGVAAETLSEGIFLVATDKLNNTSFQQTVVLLTHNSNRGTTGIAINRPSQIPLSKYLPHQKKLLPRDGELFLGGPIKPDTIFVLIKTKHPVAGMFEVAKGLFFARGIQALAKGIENKNDDEQARAYAGYTGWGPGQLNTEIDRGKWQVVRSDPSIIFDQDNKSVWEKLSGPNIKPGRWI